MDKENLFVWLFSLINRKLLLCSVTSSQRAGFAFLINRKLLLCSVTSSQRAGFAFLFGRKK